MNTLPTVGQRAYVIGRSRYLLGTNSYYLVAVTKVTPSGQVLVTRVNWDDTTRPAPTFRFSPEGHEIGGDKWYGNDIDYDVKKIAAKINQGRAQRAANDAVKAVVHKLRSDSSWSKEGLLEEVARLESLVAAARAVVEAM